MPSSRILMDNKRPIFSIVTNQMDTEDKSVKRNRALTLMLESVLKPDDRLRQCAHNQLCYHELMEYRQEMIDYLHSRYSEFN